MTGTTIERLPADSNMAAWTPPQRAYMAQLGLVNRSNSRGDLPDAPAGVIEMFIAQSMRTKLDPGNREIYCIERGGKWGVQISIDGFRLIAERTGVYEGQTTPQFSDDGRSWFEAWTPADGRTHPEFARVGVYRKGWREALVAVARFDAYCPMVDEWVNRSKTGKKVPGPMWQKMPDVMLAKVAEMLALRKAFPNDLSGLYGTEEMEQAGSATPSGSGESRASAPSQQVQEEQAAVSPQLAKEQWRTNAAGCIAIEELQELYREARREGVLGMPLASGETVDDMLQARAAELKEASKEDVVDAEVIDDGPFLKAIPLAETAEDMARIQEQAERVGAWTDEVQKAATQRAAALSWAPEDAA